MIIWVSLATLTETICFPAFTCAFSPPAQFLFPASRGTGQLESHLLLSSCLSLLTFSALLAGFPPVSAPFPYLHIIMKSQDPNECSLSFFLVHRKSKIKDHKKQQGESGVV